jgi:hypothetical protein
MSGVQTFLVLGGIVLFSTLVLSVNRALMNSEDQSIRAEYLSLAVSSGQNLLNEISSKAFDHQVVDNSPLEDIYNLTSPGLLGPEAGENSISYNDVDDYNYYTTEDSSSGRGNFKLFVRVNYVNENNGTDTLSIRSRMKRVAINVTNYYMVDTVKLYYLKSY